MSEIGTGLQNATGIRNGMARAGYAFVEASDMRNALAALRHAGRLAAVRRELERPRGRHLHGRRRPLPPPPLRGLWRGQAGPDRARRASAALPDARLQHAERRHRALVQAGDRGDRRRRLDAHHPRILPRAVRPAGARDGALAHRGPPVPHRGAARRARQAHARRHASRRRRLRAGAPGQPAQHRQRHHDGARPRQAHPGQLHPDRSARRGAGRRRALLSRRDAGRAGKSGPARLSRRAGGDVQEDRQP